MLSHGEREVHHNDHEDRNSCASVEPRTRIVSDEFEMFGHGKSVNVAPFAAERLCEAVHN